MTKETQIIIYITKLKPQFKKNIKSIINRNLFDERSQGTGQWQNHHHHHPD